MDNDFNTLEIKEILKRQSVLLQENNVLLKKMHKHAVIGFWFRIIWYILLVGLPFALYFYVLEPYFTALGSSYEVFSEGMQEIPGWKQFTQTLDAIRHTRNQEGL